MRFSFRRPSLRKRISARTSVKRYVRHSLGLKAPRGWGWLTNPKRAAYNRMYSRTTVGLGKGCLLMMLMVIVPVIMAVARWASQDENTSKDCSANSMLSTTGAIKSAVSDDDSDFARAANARATQPQKLRTHPAINPGPAAPRSCTLAATRCGTPHKVALRPFPADGTTRPAAAVKLSRGR
jgi:hypothetical protein